LKSEVKMVLSGSEMFYWRTDESWYYLDETGIYVLTDSAPERARESYKMMLEYYEEYM